MICEKHCTYSLLTSFYHMKKQKDNRVQPESQGDNGKNKLTVNIVASITE